MNELNKYNKKYKRWVQSRPKNGSWAEDLVWKSKEPSCMKGLIEIGMIKLKNKKGGD